MVADREAKSISTETTFAHDIGDRHVLRVWLLDLVDHLASRLRREGVWARTIDVKIRSSDFRTQTRSKTVAEATNLTEVIWKSAAELFERALASDGDLLPVRLLGVGTTKLTRECVSQGDLFEGERHERQSALDQTIDTIRAQFGDGSIQRGSLVERRLAESDEG